MAFFRPRIEAVLAMRDAAIAGWREADFEGRSRGILSTVAINMNDATV